jgi:hypothetical protein
MSFADEIQNRLTNEPRDWYGLTRGADAAWGEMDLSRLLGLGYALYPEANFADAFETVARYAEPTFVETINTALTTEQRRLFNRAEDAVWVHERERQERYRRGPRAFLTHAKFIARIEMQEFTMRARWKRVGFGTSRPISLRRTGNPLPSARQQHILFRTGQLVPYSHLLRDPAFRRPFFKRLNQQIVNLAIGANGVPLQLLVSDRVQVEHDLVSQVPHSRRPPRRIDRGSGGRRRRGSLR